MVRRVSLRLLPAFGVFTLTAFAQPFTDIATDAGLTAPADSNGSTVADINGDGFDDLLLVGVSAFPARTLFLYINNGDGTFYDATSEWPGLRPSFDFQVHRVSAADFDNDGDTDVLLALANSTRTELRLLRNNIIGLARPSFTLLQTFTESPTCTYHYAAWADHDNDGDLDVFVPLGGPNCLTQPLLLDNSLRQSGSATFQDIATDAGLTGPDFAPTSAHWVDVDNDGDQDLFLLNDHRAPAPVTRDLFYQNLLIESGIAVFSENAALLGLPVTSIPSSHAAFGDFDYDADQDVYLGLGFFTDNLLYQNNLVPTGALTFSDVTSTYNVGDPRDSGAVSLWADFDNDGDLDLLATVVGVNNPPSVLYDNQLAQTGAVSFIDITASAGLSDLRAVGALLLLDIENDGDLDIFAGINGSGANRLFRNDAHLWNSLTVNLVGTDSNRDGLGARLRIFAGGQYQYRQQTGPVSNRFGNQRRLVHFGVGQATFVPELQIEWPSGCQQTVRNLPTNERVTVVESCGCAPGKCVQIVPVVSNGCSVRSSWIRFAIWIANKTKPRWDDLPYPDRLQDPIDPSNPAGGEYTSFSDGHSGPCDVHDICYGSCPVEAGGFLQRLLHKRSCDREFRDNLRRVCDIAAQRGDDDEIVANCHWFAHLYSGAVQILGAQAYQRAQREYLLYCPRPYKNMSGLVGSGTPKVSEIGGIGDSVRR